MPAKRETLTLTRWLQHAGVRAARRLEGESLLFHHRQQDVTPSRRSFVVSTALVAVGAVGCEGGSASDRQLSFSSLDVAEQELTRLAQAKELASSATWTWAQTLAHCAQSIEFSMSGFPQPKSKLFQSTVGSAAFGAFAWRGRMSHDLAEPIPGAPALEVALEPEQALKRLRASILRFQQWPGLLLPHFAYGALSKKEYDLAHAMHLANHFSAFRVKA